MYLYRAVDSAGQTLDFLLNQTRSTRAAKRFFRKVLGRPHITAPRVINVAEIHALAVTEGQPGERYIVSGENLKLSELGKIIGSLTGYTPPYMPLGRSPIYLYAGLVELAAKISRQEPSLTRATVQETIGRYMYTDCRNTWQTFDYLPRSTETMVRDAIRWLLFVGEIKAKRAAQIEDKFPPDPDWL